MTVVLVSVHVRDCDIHEEGHSVSLLPTISLEGGIAAEQDLYAAQGNEAEITKRWLMTFVRYGAVDWDLCDNGEPMPFDLEALLADYSLARPVADKASELYAAAVLAPFQTKPEARSPTGRTRATTSRRRRRTPTPSVSQ